MFLVSRLSAPKMTSGQGDDEKVVRKWFELSLIVVPAII
jgi:hypothetical protein